MGSGDMVGPVALLEPTTGATFGPAVDGPARLNNYCAEKVHSPFLQQVDGSRR
jgi:hypothetical protein